MMKQMIDLTRLQLKNLYGINVFRYTKDKKEKKKKIALALAYVFILFVVCGYVAGFTFAYSYIGLSEVIPAYLIMLSSLIILFFSIFKAGSVIFQKNAYDTLTALPISQTAIVISRFIRMYVENMIPSLVVMLPAMSIYGILEKPDMTFYVIGFMVTLLLPIFPITISVFFGALITAISSKMKHKSIVSAGLSVLLMVGLMWGIPQLTAVSEEFTIEMLKNLSETIVGLIARIYPPAVWLGTAMLTGNVGICLLCMIGSLLLFGVVVGIVSKNYHRISVRLYSIGAKHDYQMETLKKETLQVTLYKRELHRYFSSGAYVTNTVIGPIMGLLFAIGLFVLGPEELQMMLEIPLDIKGMIPFFLAGIYGMMPTTCTSISMEGKEWWIIKSLPVKTKDILDAKIVLNLSLIAPFFVVSELILGMALKPTFLEMVWLLAIPIVMTLFSSVFGITINLKMPVFHWENEVSVVKQSASALVGGLGGCVMILSTMIPVIFLPQKYANIYKVAICILVLGVTVLLYNRNNSVNLQDK